MRRPNGWLSAPFTAAGDASRFGVYSERVEALLGAQREMWRPEPGAWTVIPLDREPPLFALVAADNEGERRGREVIGAFVGPAVGHLDAGLLNLSTGARADVTLREHEIRNVVALIRKPEKGPAELLAALEKLVSVRSTQPVIRRETAPPLPFLLRDFWLALQQRDADASGRLLTRIEDAGVLSADNLRFLRVDRLASLGRWQELADLPTFRDLARTRRPRRISEELMEALWTARIASEDGVISAQQALDRFGQARLAEDFSSLLRSVDVPRSAGGRRLAAVSAVLDSNDGRLERILDGAIPAEREFISDLKSLRVGGAPGADLGSLLQLGDWEGVLRAAEESPRDPQAVEAAIRAAFETEDPALSRRAVVVLNQVPDAELNQSPGFRRMLAAVRTAGQDDCQSWTTWLERIERPQEWTRAEEVLRGESQGWSVEEFASRSVSQAAADSLIAGSVNANADQVRSALDLLCTLSQSLAAREIGDPVVQAVLLVVSDQPNPSVQVREALRGLLESLLDAGPDANRYSEYVTVLNDAWQKVQSRSAFDWALDTADLLISAPCPNPDARSRFVQRVMSWAYGHHQQLDQRQVVVANTVADDVGLGGSLVPPEDTAEQASIWTRLDGARVGLYSLLPRTGSRLEERLSKLALGARVEQNSDLVATPALRALAANADYMIVDTWHATHSATNAIDSALPRNRQVLPRGGGVMSWLAALQDRLESVD